MEEKKSQAERLYNLLQDGQAHSTIEIMERVYGNDHLGLARVGARIYDVKKRYGVEVEGRKDNERKSIYWYRLVKPGQGSLL